MLTFQRDQTQAEKDKREARYSDMSEDDLRFAVDRFSRELKEKPMAEFECHLKTNSLRFALKELNKRGLPVAPVVISTQGGRPSIQKGERKWLNLRTPQVIQLRRIPAR